MLRTYDLVLVKVSKFMPRSFLDNPSLPGHHHDRGAASAAGGHDGRLLLRPKSAQESRNFLHLSATNQHLRKVEAGESLLRTS